MINEINENELIKSFYNLIPYFKYYFDDELIFTISNTEKFLLVQDNENLKMASKTGDHIPDGCAADICLKQNKQIQQYKSLLKKPRIMHKKLMKC